MFSAVLPITDMGRLSRAARPSAGQNRGTVCPASHFLTDTALYAHFCLIAFLRNWTNLLGEIRREGSPNDFKLQSRAGNQNLD